VGHNVYSVDSRLIGESVEARIHAEQIDLWYGSRCVERLPRLRGENRHLIQYRHIIDWLVRKPGAFANYRYRADLFPTSRFRMAYDNLRTHSPLQQAEKTYLRILHLAAKHSQSQVEQALIHLLGLDRGITVEAVEVFLAHAQPDVPRPEVCIPPVDLACYDGLLQGQEVAAG
jgi:hypothetical protein